MSACGLGVVATTIPWHLYLVIAVFSSTIGVLVALQVWLWPARSEEVDVARRARGSATREGLAPRASGPHRRRAA